MIPESRMAIVIRKLKPTVADPTPGAKLASPIQRKVSKAIVVG
jgi:hypothetical protein